MDKVSKFLKRLHKDEREQLEEVLRQIKSSDLSGLDVKKLKGKSGLFRVRKGSARFVFVKAENATNVISIDRRDKDTYKDF